MIEFHVDAMSCSHCVAVVTKTVQQVDPAAKVMVDLGSHTVKIESSAERQRIAAALKDAGYEPA